MPTTVKRRYNASLRQEQAQMTRSRIVDAARRLLTKGTYGSVTMEDIAREAGVSYQTVYAVFGTKLSLAQEILRVGFTVEGLEELAEELLRSSDPEVLLRGSAQISRHIYETCADLLRFMERSGDPELLARYHEHEELRLTQEGFLPAALNASGRLQAGITQAEILAVIWALTGSDTYSRLVFERGWAPSRYEEWLGASLISLLLKPLQS